jgi:hypothetical protein
MRRSLFLTGHVSLWHVLALNVLTIAVTAIIVAAASAGAAFRPAGTVRLASTSSNASVKVAGSDGQTVIQQVAFRVPAGHRADVMAFWNAGITKADQTAVGLCFASMRLDDPAGSDLLPGQMTVLDGGVTAGGGAFHGENAGLQAQRNGIGPGSHTLFVIAETGGAGCWYGSRSLFVVANLI